MKFPIVDMLLLLEAPTRDVKGSRIVVNVCDRNLRLRTPIGMTIGTQQSLEKPDIEIWH